MEEKVREGRKGGWRRGGEIKEKKGKVGGGRFRI